MTVTRGRWFLLAAGLGGLFRVAQYAARTSLWHDEAFVALNVLSRSPTELLQRLDWNEASPPGFLLIERAVVLVLGKSEYSLRLVPVLAGVAGMFAFAALARRLSPSSLGGLLAVVLAAASPKLVVQANETKHFTLDFLLAVLLIGSAIRVLGGGPSFSRAIAGWCALGALGIWLSYASFFVFAATSLVLAFQARRWQRRARFLYLAANAAVLVSFGLLLAPILAQRSGRVLEFWAARFPDMSGPAALAVWMARALIALFDYFWQPFGALLLALAVLGAILYRREGRGRELTMLWLPVALSLAASFARFWPFGGNQHMAFAAPAVLLAAGEGAEVVRQRLDARWAKTGEVFTAALLLPGVGGALYHVAVPRLRHEIRPVVEFVSRNQRAGDELFVFCRAEYEYYTERKAPEVGSAPDPCRRVWIVTARATDGQFPRQDLLASLGHRRARLLTCEEYGAAAYLFDSERCGVK